MLVIFSSCVSLSEYNKKKTELGELEMANKNTRKEIRALEKENKVLSDTISARLKRKSDMAESIRRRLESYKIKARINQQKLEGLVIYKPITDPGEYADLRERYPFRDTNSAKNTSWMSDKEKKCLYYLNVARMDPQGFCNRYIIPKWKRDTGNIYLLTLIDYMYSMKPLNALKPDKVNFESAKCHAVESGKTGFVGHARNSKNCPVSYYGECCSYGIEDPLGVILQLLIDEGVSSLGHRYICLSWYESVGIAQAPHSSFGVNTVLDFK